MRILITGASGGIGRCLTAHFDQPQNTLFLARRRSLTEDVSMAAWKVMPCDFTDAQAVEGLFAEMPPLDAIINCMGHVENALVKNMTESEWDDVIASNLKTVFLSCRYGVGRVVDGGHIINISSVLGATGKRGASNYCAAKGGVEAFTRSFALECLAEYNRVYVNAISLGFFTTGMGSDLLPDVITRTEALIPLKRFGDPAEICRAVDFILASEYLVGSTLRINGGLCNS